MEKVSSEALLEMHFARDMGIAMNAKYGFGKNTHFLKPSQHDEGWLGFDQSWGKPTKIPNTQFVKLIKHWIGDPKGKQLRFFGEFHQYKRVYMLSSVGTRHPKSTKSILEARFPGKHCKIDLLTQPKEDQPLSQHKMLCRLASVKGAQVYYICPVILDEDIKLWMPADLKKINWIQVTPHTLKYEDKLNHHIYFEDENDRAPIWCSEPTKGKSLGIDSWQRRNNPRRFSIGSGEIVEFFDSISNIASDHGIDTQIPRRTISDAEFNDDVEYRLRYFAEHPINHPNFPKNFVLAISEYEEPRYPENNWIPFLQD